MSRPGLGRLVLLAAARLLAGTVQSAESAPGEYWVIVIPGRAPGDVPHEGYYEMAIYRLPG